MNTGRGSIGKLMTDDTLYNRLNDTAGKLENIANSVDSGKGTAGMLLKDDTLYKNLNSTLAHANSIMADADAGKGGLGLMLKDPKFRADLSNTLTRSIRWYQASMKAEGRWANWLRMMRRTRTSTNC